MNLESISSAQNFTSFVPNSPSLLSSYYSKLTETFNGTLERSTTFIKDYLPLGQKTIIPLQNILNPSLHPATQKNLNQFYGFAESQNLHVMDPLKNIELESRGYCFGMVQNVFVHYLSAPLSGRRPDHLEEIMTHYQSGIVPEAAAAQLVYASLSHEKLIEKSQSYPDELEKSNALFIHSLKKLSSEVDEVIIDKALDVPTHQLHYIKDVLYRSIKVRLFLEAIETSPKYHFGETSLVLRKMLFEWSISHYQTMDPTISTTNQETLNAHPLFMAFRSCKNKGPDYSKNYTHNWSSFSEELKEILERLEPDPTKLAEYQAALDLLIGLYQFIEGIEANNLKASDLLKLFFLHSSLKDSYIDERSSYQFRGLDFKSVENLCGLFVQSDDDIFRAFQSLDPGSYTIIFSVASGREDGKHAIGYQKYPDGSAHFFDSNYYCAKICDAPHEHEVEFRNIIGRYKSPHSEPSGNNHRVHFYKVTVLDP